MLTNLYSCQNETVSGKVRGFTLIEVLVTIVVLSLAATAIMGVFISTVKTSADPLIQQQAISIAEAYMEEILSKSFDDPTGDESGESRANFDDVDDYHGLTDSGVVDQSANSVSGLSAYTVSVSVAGQALNGIGAADARRIDIAVSHAAIDPILLSGFRVRH